MSSTFHSSSDFGQDDHAAITTADPFCGIKHGETPLQAAEGWAQWCEVRGNQMLANFYVSTHHLRYT